MVRHVPSVSIIFIENPPLQCAIIFCALLFFLQKFCIFSATLNKCNFWGTFWPELCVQECYSLSLSVCLSTSEHESASMEKHVHDIDWSWMRHFLNPTLSIVWWIENWTTPRISIMKETWFHFSTFEFGSKWFIWFKINNDLQLPFCHNFQHVTSLMVSHVQYFPFFLLSQSLKCALNKLGLHSIDRIFQPEVCHNPDILESTQVEALRDLPWFVEWLPDISDEHDQLNTCFYASHFSLKEDIQLIILHYGFSEQNMGVTDT